MTDDEFAQLEAMLDGMRQRRPATPTWEFCEGFMAVVQVWSDEWEARPPSAARA